MWCCLRTINENRYVMCMRERNHFFYRINRT